MNDQNQKRPDKSPKGQETDQSCCKTPPTTNQPDCCAPVVDCCGSSGPTDQYLESEGWTIGQVSTPAGDIPQVATRLTRSDKFGHWRVRWNIGRMRFAIRPGLYAVGQATRKSPVFVTANYKQSFDRLREQLDGRDGWILVLDTKGINVWCAAGKGTFGTDEMINRVRDTHLSEVVSHRRLIVPQLGAPGVQAHVVQEQTGFVVRYGPIRAADLPSYLDNGRKVTPEMRLVTFPIGDRLALAPMELVGYGKYVLRVILVLGLLSGFGSGIYSAERVVTYGLWAAVPLLAGLLAGAVLVPALLRWLPGTSFSAKGIWAGWLIWILLSVLFISRPYLAPNWAGSASGVLLTLSVASFIGMNFTGSSTYTSLSGVRREMKRWVPVQAVLAVVGLGLWLTARFI